ncbi:unnamed protein product [Pipistrellus nathusii]|uniref:Phosducin thioredoxin-like domain-containing protein n=1 Tax=Pipistrellus nathusii TaxID=59473 RepID=A0ABP0A2I9_PIPNA
MTQEELEDNEDELNEEEEQAIGMDRQQRLAEWKATQLRNKSGEVLETSGRIMFRKLPSWRGLVGDPVPSQTRDSPLFPEKLAFSGLARKLPEVKFTKAFPQPDTHYPDRNLPTIFVYVEGAIKAQFMALLVFGDMNLTIDELSESVAIKTDLEENLKKPVEDACLLGRSSVPMSRGSDSEAD